MNSEELRATETAADNCEVLRARLAKYEDADGNALGAAGVIEALKFARTVMAVTVKSETLSAVAQRSLLSEINRADTALIDYVAAPKPADHVEDARHMVPYDPTPEMVAAAEDAYFPFGDMELAVRMAILAAPKESGE